MTNEFGYVWITCPQSWKGALHFSLSCRIRFVQLLAAIAVRLVCFALPQNNPTWQADWVRIVLWSLRWIQKLRLYSMFSCCHFIIAYHGFYTHFWFLWHIIATFPIGHCLRTIALPFEAGRWSKNGTGRQLLKWVGRSSVQDSCDHRMFYHVVPCCTMLYQVLVVLRSESNQFVGLLPQPLWLNSFRSFTERLFGRVATLYWISMNVEEGSPGSVERWWVWWDGVIAPWFQAETHLGSPKKDEILWNIQVLEAQCNCKSIELYSRNFGQLRGMLLDLWHCWIYRWPRRLCWVHVQQQRLTSPYPVLAMNLQCPCAQVLSATNCWSSCSSLNMQLAIIRDQELGGNIRMFVASDAIDSV